MFKTAFAAAVIASLAVCTFAKPAHAQIVGNTGRVVTGAYFDYNSGTWVVNTDKRVLFNSALDPDRDTVDPGSYENVNYTKCDSNGTLWHYTGARWTSYGVPHSTVTRQNMSQVGNNNVYVNQSETQYRSSRGGRQVSRNSDIRPQGSNSRHAGW